MIKKNISIFVFCIICFCFTGRITAQEILLDRDKDFLINIARQTLYWHIEYGEVPEVEKEILSKPLLQKRDCFVTLKKKGLGLRGCMGTFGTNRPLYENVIDRAIAAASNDPRFPKVKYEELKDIKIEISVLTEPKKLLFDSPEDLLTKLHLLRDGIILETRYGRSTFLPQVWEQISEEEQFLYHLCKKHGAPGNIWKNEYKNIKVSTYKADVFGEEIYGRIIVGKKGAIVGENGALVLGAVIPLENGLFYGESIVSKGTKLAPGAIVSPKSDIMNIR